MLKLAAVSLALGLAAPALGNVFSQDDRSTVTSTSTPWSAVGRITWGDGSGWCTGSLVGEDLVLTARHCATDAQGQFRDGLRFLPGYKNGIGAEVSYVAWAWWSDASSDWAILRLNSRLGDEVGWVGFTKTEISDIADWRGWLSLVGYSGDAGATNGRFATVHQNCGFEGWSGTWIDHSCDATSGADGAPIMGQWDDGYYVTAIHVGEQRGNSATSLIGIPYSYARRNQAVAVDAFYDRLVALRGNDEGRSAWTYVQLCNKSGRDRLYAIVAWKNVTWRTKGWWGIDNGTCAEVPVAEGYEGNVHVFAWHDNGATNWGGGPSDFCINTNGFEYDEADTRACDQANDKKVNFSNAFQASRTAYNSWNFLP